MSEQETRVAIRMRRGVPYPKAPPFDPQVRFAEQSEAITCDGENAVYDLVRASFQDLRLDEGRMERSDWSPFSDFIKPGNTVVIKPNLVLDVEDQDAVTTHASVIRPIIDYCWKALAASGRIIVCDAPQSEANFSEIVRKNGLRETIDILRGRGVNVMLEDLRALRVIIRNGIWVEEAEVVDKRNDALVVDLGAASALAPLDSTAKEFQGGGYGRYLTAKRHSEGIHQYCVSRTVLSADVVISVPKLKTHKKAGLTCCLKNLVGINVDKNYLPHFSLGPGNAGGDEFPAVPAWRIPLIRGLRFMHDLVLDRHWRATGKIVAGVMGLASKVLPQTPRDKSGRRGDSADSLSAAICGVRCRQGAWQGNETIWRMILDLNRLFLYCRSDGKMSDVIQRKVFYVADGIISGEGDGPMAPDLVPAGIIAAGFNGFFVDEAILKLAGINAAAIPLYREALGQGRGWLYRAGEFEISFNGQPMRGAIPETGFTLRPPRDWSFR